MAAWPAKGQQHHFVHLGRDGAPFRRLLAGRPASANRCPDVTGAACSRGGGPRHRPPVGRDLSAPAQGPVTVFGDLVSLYRRMQPSGRGSRVRATDGVPLHHGGTGHLRFPGGPHLRHRGHRRKALCRQLSPADPLHAAVQHHRRVQPDPGAFRAPVRQRHEQHHDRRHPADHRAVDRSHSHAAVGTFDRHGPGLHLCRVVGGIHQRGNGCGNDDVNTPGVPTGMGTIRDEATRPSVNEGRKELPETKGGPLWRQSVG
ncbi:hypothetical protein DESC_780266 [Desulfosarcina cetonica]|nr:hypothetical protein DESC_780266 [Desulfosarcina cetonica]